MSAVALCADVYTDGYFVEEMFITMADFVEEPKRILPPSQRTPYLYDLPEIILPEFIRLKQTPGICEMPGTGEIIWF